MDLGLRATIRERKLVLRETNLSGRFIDIKGKKVNVRVIL